MSSFTFSDCPTTLALTEAEQNGKKVATGSLRLNVRNTTTRGLIGTISVLPEDLAQSGWFRIAGAAPTSPAKCDIDCAGNTAQSVEVVVTVPEGAPPGRKTFNLRVVATEHDPDNDFADSPAISFEVKAPPPPKVEPKKPFPWWIVAVAVLAVAVVGGVIWKVLPTDNRVVPTGLKGKPFPDAVIALSKSDFDIDAEHFATQSVSVQGRPNLEVIDVNPPEGATLKPGQKLVLSVNTVGAQAPPASQPCQIADPIRRVLCRNLMETVVRLPR